MLFLQILSVVAATVFAVWLLGVGLASVFIMKAKPLLGNLWLGIPLLALAIWLPFAYGWLPV
jgi:hypothetical protein